jgi:rare lipoprotein A
MKQMSIRSAGLLAVFCFAGFQQASAECGIAGAYASGSAAAHGDPSSLKKILGAHRSLPRGTRVVVRNQQKGRSIVVPILGTALSGLEGVIDLSAGAMRALGMEAPAPVCVEVLTYGSKSRGYQKTAMRDIPVRAGRLETVRYARASGRTRLARRSRNVHKARARYEKGKRYAKLHRHGRTAKRSARRRRSARR